ncbi:hypothetical protein ABVT42_21795 [Aliikangiella sp. GXAS 306]
MMQVNSFLKVSIRLILIAIGLLSICSCADSKKVLIFEENPICIPHEEFVAIDWGNNGSAKEVSVRFDIPVPEKNDNSTIYAHITAQNKFIGSLFYKELRSSVDSVKKAELERVYGLRKMESKDSAGVFHLFDDNYDLSLDSYVASCFTLSDSMGECTLGMDSDKYHLKIDFDLSQLKYWSKIKEQSLISFEKYKCK